MFLVIKINNNLKKKKKNVIYKWDKMGVDE